MIRRKTHFQFHTRALILKEARGVIPMATTRIKRANPQKNNHEVNPGLHGEKLSLVSVSADDTVEQALLLMKRNGLSDLLVMDRRTDPQALLGVISDREIALSLLENPEFKNRSVSELMTGGEVTGAEGEDFFQLVRKMEEFQLARLPIKDAEGRVVSIVTSKNLLELLVRSLFEMNKDPKSKAEADRIQH